MTLLSSILTPHRAAHFELINAAELVFFHLHAVAARDQPVDTHNTADCADSESGDGKRHRPFILFEVWFNLPHSEISSAPLYFRFGCLIGIQISSFNRMFPQFDSSCLVISCLIFVKG